MANHFLENSHKKQFDITTSLITLAKFRNTKGASCHAVLMSNCPTSSSHVLVLSTSNWFIVYPLIMCGVWEALCTTMVCCEKSVALKPVQGNFLKSFTRMTKSSGVMELTRLKGSVETHYVCDTTAVNWLKAVQQRCKIILF